MSTIVFVLLGWLAALPFVVELSRVSGLLALLGITALIGSFLHGFAELGKSEGWQKFILLHAPEFIIGLYIPVAWHEAKFAGMLLLVSAGIIHVAIWKASVHSRNFRRAVLQASRLLENKKSWQAVSFMLNIRGDSDISDAIIKAMGEGKEITLTDMRDVLKDAKDELIEKVRQELTEVQANLYKHPAGVK